ncbi:MAG: dihydroxy-acid dehydratase, partial [Pseudomonas sp.]|nr:dihydroxy-acid dehydratase [Pseudomonas sp.]
ASGQVSTALHVTPEAAAGGALARLQDGDWLVLDTQHGLLQVELSEQQLAARPLAAASVEMELGYGLEMFGAQRRLVGSAEQGASSLFED